MSEFKWRRGMRCELRSDEWCNPVGGNRFDAKAGTVVLVDEDTNQAPFVLFPDGKRAEVYSHNLRLIEEERAIDGGSPFDGYDEDDQSAYDLAGAEAYADALDKPAALASASAAEPFVSPPIDTYSASAAILSEALSITQGARNATHGPKERSFKALAGLFNAYIEARKEGRDAPLTALDVSNLMILLKIGRSIQGQPLRDHYVDMAGYAGLSGELAEAA